MTKEQELVKEAARLVGSQAELSRRTGISANFINQMINGRRSVPNHACVKIEQATKGIVNRKRFRPDSYKDLWPELVDQLKQTKI